MKTFLWIALGLGLVAGLFLLAGQMDQPGATRAPDYRSIIDEMLQDDRPGIALRVITPKFEVLEMRGLVDWESEIPLGEDHLFRVASCTKTFIATLVLIQHFEGNLDLDDAITEYLPESITNRIQYADQITIRQLLTHTSGIFNTGDHPEYWAARFGEPTRIWTDTELLEFALDQPANFEPGAGYGYSNTDYLLAGLILDQVLGYHHSQELRSRILEPLGLTSTFYENQEPVDMQRLSHGYFDFDGDGIAEDYYDLQVDTGTAAGGLISTAEDLATFIAALATNRSFHDASYKEQFMQELLAIQPVSSEEPGQVGTGPGIAEYDFGYGPTYGHSGGIPGYVSLMVYFAEHDVTFAMTWNGFDGGFADFGRVPALYEALIDETFSALGIESTLADEDAPAGNVYKDPAGRFTMPLVGDWTPIETDGTYAKFALSDLDFAMSITTIEAADAEGDMPSALASVGIDPASVTESYRGNWNKWLIIYYAHADGSGVTALGQIQDGIGYYVIATGDPDLTGNPPENVMQTLGGFALTGEAVLPATVAEFESYANEIVGVHPPALSIAIATTDGMIYSQGFGMADRPEGMQATPDTVYFWGSIAKTVTATAIMQLHEQGLVDLEAPVSDYLDYVPSNYGITVLNLLTHSSGLPEPHDWLPKNLRFAGQDLPDFDAMDREYYAELTDLMFEPGSQSAYANPAWVTLGQIVAAVSEQPYVEYVREHILGPLGMTTTDFEYSSEAMLAAAAGPATSLSNREAMIELIDDARGLGDGADFFRETDEDNAWMSHFIVGESAGGGLMGPVTEMVRYGQMLLNSGELAGARILSAESVELLAQEQVSTSGEPFGFGLAWWIRDDSEHPYIEHGGGGEGVDALLRIYPQDGFAIALEANSGGYSRQEMMDAAANVVITMFGGGEPAAPPQLGEGVPPGEALQGLLDQQVADQGILGMAMAVRQADGSIIETASGFADPAEADAWSVDTVTAVGSVTKPFVAVVTMQLVEEKKLSLDATIEEWFPDIPEGDAITIRMLLSHTSGIANFISIENVMSGKWSQEWTLREIVSEGVSLGFVGEPGGEEAHYSNTAYYVLAVIIEAITGNDWKDEVLARIVTPLNMSDTTFLSAQGVLETMVGGYGMTASGFANMLDESWFPHPSAAGPAGELVSTVSDLMTFASALFDGDLVSRESLATMATPMGHEALTGMDWGLGGFVIQESGLVAFGMGGDIPGFHAFFIGILDTDLVVTAACNTQEGELITPSLAALEYIKRGTATDTQRDEGLTPPIVDADGNAIPGSIAVIETVTLGGVEQTITLRGVDTTKPVLLFLHGGPGMPSSPWATWNNVHADLEEEFVLVHWDQRGAGKSYSADLTADDMHVSNFVSDTLELTDILRKRFDQRKIFLWGHSWGSGLGFETLRVNSEPYYAYIASAVRPDWHSTQELGYEKVLGIALRERDAEAIEALESIQPFDPANLEHVGLRGQYLSQYLVGDFHMEGLEDAWLDYVFSDSSPEYPASLIDQTMAGMEFTDQTIGLEVMTNGYDHYADFPVSTIPVYFVHGRYDYQCPGELAEIYYGALRAPVKEFIWFENSAHDVYYDEPDRFNQELIRIANEVLTTLPPDLRSGADHEAATALQGLVDQQVAEQGILGMAMAVRQADGTVLGSGSGLTDPESLNVWSPNTVTAVGSVTKTFTAVAIMQLVEEGKLSLEQTIEEWFPAQPRGDEITIRMLLSHTSGVARYISFENLMAGKWNREWAPLELVSDAISLGPVSDPGSPEAHYSNTAYIMLGLIIEAITENSWRDEVIARIVTPLGMVDTTFLSAAGVLDSMIGGYARTEGGFANALIEPWYPHPSTVWSAGEIVTTVSDLMTFASALFDGQLVTRESLGIMATPLGFEEASGRDWGLGGAVITEGEMIMFGMGGDIPGFHAFFVGVLDTPFLVAAACNTEGSDVITPSFGALQYIMGAAGE
ncbi:alpha/beta fold hydrolase [Candidatus Bipolaricaulota bacterium]